MQKRKQSAALHVQAQTPGTKRLARVRSSLPPTELEGLEPDAERAWRHDNIGRLFVFAFHFFEERLLRRVHEAGHPEVKYIHFNLFRTVDANGTRLVDLARRVGVTKAAMGQLAREGERVGLFRIGADPSDGRAKIVSFTAKGQRLHRTFKREILALEEDFKKLLGKERYRSLREDLLYLRAQLSGARAEATAPRSR
jgi:DNA-binding MarR family transcriptional regulator